MKIQVLGPIEVHDDSGTRVDLGSRRQRRLLGGLLINAGALVSDDRLLEIVWDPEHLPEGGVRALRTVVSRLRTALDTDAPSSPDILTRPTGYLLELNGTRFDANEFEATVRLGTEHLANAAFADAKQAFDDGLALWRGGAYAEFADEVWAQPEAARLEELRAVAEEGRAEAKLGLGEHAELIGELEAVVAAHPYRDRPLAQLVTALYRCGRQADALRAYHQYRALLADELGLDPSPELRELERQVLNQDPSLAAPTPGGRSLRSYELLEPIGSGAWGEVWRARQQSVDREVAVKVIGRELADDPSFIRRFEVEARTVASLEHPHIVPLYDFWRDPTGAYLVMRLLRGGSLAARLERDGPLSLAAATLLVDHLGSALGAAHRAGVVHRDVKPSNVLTDEDGNAYLGDFGIAQGGTDAVSGRPSEVSGDGSRVATGSIGYAAPEQLRGEQVGCTADVYGLAITVWEALAGARVDARAALSVSVDGGSPPALRRVRPDLPVAIEVVLRRAIAFDPATRPGTVAEFADQFRRAAATTPIGTLTSLPAVPTSTTLVPGRDATNPYKGLRPFGIGDESDFFGRDDVIEQILAKVRDHRFVAVVGPSGAGKSSVVRAGVLPALRDGGVPGSAEWFVITMQPGRNPFEELEAALLHVAVNPPASLLEQLESGPTGIGRAIKRSLPARDVELLLVIDQFEELFTQCPSEVADRFIDGITTAVAEPGSCLRVLATLRADFFDRPLSDHRLAAAIGEAIAPVGAMSPDGLAMAITGPAHRVGLIVEQPLVSELLADAGAEASSLPLLQYMLSELFDRRSGATLLLDAYHRLGGVRGVIAQRAEAVFADLTPQTQLVARRVFGRLVAVGEGTADTRRRALRSDVVSGDSGVEAAEVIDRFGRVRLLSFDHDPTTRQATVEIAHEALLSAWPRLRAWLDEDADLLRTLAHVGAAADDWRAGGSEPGDLLRGARLAAAIEFTDRFPDRLTVAEREYVEASREASVAERTRQRRQNRRLRGALGAAAALLATSVTAGIVVVNQRATAREEAFRAVTASLVGQSAIRADDDLGEAALLAVEARRREQTPATLGALQRVFLNHPSYSLGPAELGVISDVAFLPSGDLVVASQRGLGLIDVETRRRTQLLDNPPSTVAAAGDGSLVFAANATGWWLVDPSNGEISSSGPIDGSPPARAAFSSDGRAIVVIDTGAVATIRDRRGTVLTTVDTGISDVLATGALAVDPDSSNVVAVSRGDVVLIDLAAGRIAASIDGQASNGGAVFHDHQLWIAAGQVRAYDPRTLSPVSDPIDFGNTVPLPTGPLALGAFEGALFVDGSDGTVVVDLGTHEVRGVATDAGNQSARSVIDPNHPVLAKLQNSVFLSALDGSGLGVVASLPDNGGEAQITTDGTLLVTGGGEEAVVWGLARPLRRLAVVDTRGTALYVAGNDIVLIDQDVDAGVERIEVWDRQRRAFEPIGEHPAAAGGVVSVAVSDEVIAVGRNGTLDVYSRADGRSLATHSLMVESSIFGTEENKIVDIVFSPDGERLVAMTIVKMVVVYSTTTWEALLRIDAPSQSELISSDAGFNALTFAPDGSVAYTFSVFNGLRRRDPVTFDVLAGASDPAGIGGIFLSPHRVLEMSADGTTMKLGDGERVVLIDVATLSQIGDPFPSDGQTFGKPPQYATSAGLLATVEDGRVIVRDVRPDTWERLACLIPGLNMITEWEWDRLGLDGPVRKICDNLDFPQ